jgi:hypothetical protein
MSIFMASLSSSLTITAGIVVVLSLLALVIFALRRANEKVEAALREELDSRPPGAAKRPEPAQAVKTARP